MFGGGCAQFVPSFPFTTLIKSKEMERILGLNKLIILLHNTLK